MRVSVTGQHDRQVKFLGGPVAILARHCRLTGCYFEPWSESCLNLNWGKKRSLSHQNHALHRCQWNEGSGNHASIYSLFYLFIPRLNLQRNLLVLNNYNSPALSSLWPLNKRGEDASFTGLASIWSKYIHKFQRDEDLFITLSIVYFQISNTYLLEFVNILRCVKANPIWMCR